VALTLLHIPETEPVLMSRSTCSKYLHSQKFSGPYTAEASDPVATEEPMVSVMLLTLGILEVHSEVGF
jgi:hypothetical protein